MGSIYFDEVDAKEFIQIQGQMGMPIEWVRHQFHLVVETPNGNLVLGMKWFLGTSTSRSNRGYQCFSHLFSGRYKSWVVGEGGSNSG